MTSWWDRRGRWTAATATVRRRQPVGSRGAPGVPQGGARGQARRRGAGGLQQEHDPDPVPRPAARGGRAGAGWPATDMELSLRVPVAATVEQPGAVVLPRLAGDIVRSMADGPVTLEHRAGEGVVSVSGGGSSFSLNCLQAGDFPELPADEGTRPDACRPTLLVGDDRPGGAGRVARRDAPGADGRAAAPRARRPDDGGDRLVPPGGARRPRSTSRRPTRARRSCRRAR